MKWEDKLVGRHFMIVTDHEALETIKTTNCDGRSGRLIHWDEYLSQFKYNVMHVPGVQNKVSECLSQYYENDRFDEVHEPHEYVLSDVRLDPNHEDLTELRLLELAEGSTGGQLLARRLHDQNEDRVAEADWMASAAKETNAAGEANMDDLTLDITVGEALQNGPSLRRKVLGDKSFLQAVKDGYKEDSVFSKVVDNPGHYPTFRLNEGLMHTKNRLGENCLCIPRSLINGKRSLPEVVIDLLHTTLGHLGAQKTSEYTRRWFWWPQMG